MKRRASTVDDEIETGWAAKPERNGRVALAPPADFDPETGCPKCGREMRVKTGYRGNFWACTGYPECRVTKSIPPTIISPGAEDAAKPLDQLIDKRSKDLLSLAATPKELTDALKVVIEWQRLKFEREQPAQWGGKLGRTVSGE